MHMPSVSEPRIFVSYSSADMMKIASLAKQLRHDLGLSPEKALPIVDILEFEIIRFLEDFRLVVDVETNFEPSVLAMARLNPPEIIVRESVYLHAAAGFEPARVILAHELGHLWLSHGGNFSAVKYGLPEWEADEFAAELLMPSAIAVKMTADLIAEQFAVPLRTATRRLRALVARQKKSSITDVPRFELYEGLLSRYETDVLRWVPINWTSTPAVGIR